MNSLRIGGIASGFDTNQIVKDLMRIEKMKIDKFYQQRQLTEWRKTQYREVINSIRSFKDTFFDVLRPETNLLSPTSLKKMQASSNNSEIVTAAANANANVGDIDFKVIQSASAARVEAAGFSAGLESSETITEPITVMEGKNIIKATLNNTTVEITLSAGEYETLEDLTTEIQEQLNTAFGEDRVSVTDNQGRLKFTATYGSDTFSLASDTYHAEEDIDSEDILAQLNIKSGANNQKITLTDTMEKISDRLAGGSFEFDEEGRSSFLINGQEITFNKTDTFQKVINRINDSKAGVQASYSSYSDTFTLVSRTTGNSHITTDNGGNFFSAFGIESVEGKIGEAGRNAIFEINGTLDTHVNNTFTIEGVTYTINKEINPGDEPETAKISVSLDTEATFQVIEKFVNDYNTLIDEINGKLKEESFRDFQPLTDEQKEAMSDKEIEIWEEKAQSGLLRRDSTLTNMLFSMRQALYDTVGDLHLTEMGIQTSSNYQDNGKLVLKDGGSALRMAIENNPDRVMDVFSRRSDISYSPNMTQENRSQRYSESGLAHRLSDIINDNIRTIRDNSGRKGFLLEKAGIEGDTTQFNNFLDRNITNIDKRIIRMEEILFKREEQYYRQFMAMEKALQQLYSQGDWLMMQLDQGR
ncbi:flagellar filament capping protein FliD [Candidatus Contubernalis alkaliaceticus]|uniref:flagellar filament capping protein FliD n=1 Tax=Candidatus Contubernalis alkaliaceticus TaxID=338645 RepID=UPI001F4C26D7|nr:flagellar filament capping protein FliD [Candidatus Contubernalis alkalaceticus]UNC91738.1 flagellar filament capping protein FliD [Candidatus Contubernalis alkalaceticus]